MGAAFASAVIDAATIIGAKSPATPTHRLVASVHDAENPLSQKIAQRDFWLNPRLTFNLYMTPEKRELLDHLQRSIPLGDAFEVHEGVHSGNIRAELFVAENVDNSCQSFISAGVRLSDISCAGAENIFASGTAKWSGGPLRKLWKAPVARARKASW